MVFCGATGNYLVSVYTALGQLQILLGEYTKVNLGLIHKRESTTAVNYSLGNEGKIATVGLRY
jgi:hypothetical protein